MSEEFTIGVKVMEDLEFREKLEAEKRRLAGLSIVKKKHQLWLDDEEEIKLCLKTKQNVGKLRYDTVSSEYKLAPDGETVLFEKKGGANLIFHSNEKLRDTMTKELPRYVRKLKTLQKLTSKAIRKGFVPHLQKKFFMNNTIASTMLVAGETTVAAEMTEEEVEYFIHQEECLSSERQLAVASGGHSFGTSLHNVAGDASPVMFAAPLLPHNLMPSPLASTYSSSHNQNVPRYSSVVMPNTLFRGHLASPLAATYSSTHNQNVPLYPSAIMPNAFVQHRDLASPLAATYNNVDMIDGAMTGMAVSDPPYGDAIRMIMATGHDYISALNAYHSLATIDPRFQTLLSDPAFQHQLRSQLQLLQQPRQPHSTASSFAGGSAAASAGPGAAASAAAARGDDNPATRTFSAIRAEDVQQCGRVLNELLSNSRQLLSNIRQAQQQLDRVEDKIDSATDVQREDHALLKKLEQKDRDLREQNRWQKVDQILENTEVLVGRDGNDEPEEDLAAVADNGSAGDGVKSPDSMSSKWDVSPSALYDFFDEDDTSTGVKPYPKKTSTPGVYHEFIPANSYQFVRTKEDWEDEWTAKWKEFVALAPGGEESRYRIETVKFLESANGSELWVHHINAGGEVIYRGLLLGVRKFDGPHPLTGKEHSTESMVSVTSKSDGNHVSFVFDFWEGPELEHSKALLKNIHKWMNSRESSRS
jgi:hypothetical protein